MLLVLPMPCCGTMPPPANERFWRGFGWNPETGKCRHCGASMADYQCASPTCNYSVEKGQRFCEGCAGAVEAVLRPVASALCEPMTLPPGFPSVEDRIVAAVRALCEERDTARSVAHDADLQAHSDATKESWLKSAGLVHGPEVVRRLELDPSAVRTEFFRRDGQGVNETPAAVRLTHVPTGIVVESARLASRVANLQRATERLRRAVLEHTGRPPWEGGV